MANRVVDFPLEDLAGGEQTVSREGVFASLVFAVVGDSQELISGVKPQRMGSATRGNSRDGMGWRSTSNTADGVYYTLPGDHPLYLLGTDFTIFQVAQIDSWGAYSCLLMVPYFSGAWGSPYGSMGLQRDASNNRLRLFGNAFDNPNTITVSSGGRYVVTAARYSGGCRWLINGSYENSTSGAGRTNAPTFNTKNPPILFNHSSGDAGEGVTGSSPVTLIFNRALTEPEMRWLADNWREVADIEDAVAPLPTAGGSSVSLIVADATHAHTADGMVLTSSTALAVAEATHAHAADAITLAVGSVLTVAEASHAHAADSPALTAASALAVADAAHSHAADNITLSVAGATNLTVADALHGHAADALALTSAHALIVADATHGHTVDGLTLTAASVLAIQEALHAHAADNITLDASGAVNLLLADGLHAHTADGVALTVAAWLTVADALHGHAADNVVLTFGGAVVEPLARYTIAAKARRLTITAAARRLEIRK